MTNFLKKGKRNNPSCHIFYALLITSTAKSNAFYRKKKVKNHKPYLIFFPKKVIDKKSFLGYKPFESIPKYLTFLSQKPFLPNEKTKNKTPEPV